MGAILEERVKKPSSNEKQRAPGHFSCWSAGVTYRNLTEHSLFPTTNTQAQEEFLSHLQPDAAINTQQEGEGPTASLRHNGAKPRSSDTNKATLLTATQCYGMGTEEQQQELAFHVLLQGRSFQVGLLLFMGSQSSSVISPLHLLNSHSLTMRTFSFFGAWLRCREKPQQHIANEHHHKLRFK